MRTIPRSFFLFLFAFILLNEVQSQEQKRLLSSLCTMEYLTNHIQSQADFHPFPVEAQRTQWDKMLSPQLKAAYIAEGEKWIHKPWKVLPVSDFLSFYRNGNRTRYESLIFGRRERLASLVMAEVVEGKGRFLNDIINGIWATSEETFWGIPAHISYRNSTKGFPDENDQIVDLFNAETASLFAWTYYLLKDELDSVSPIIRQRMFDEVNRRMLEPCMKTDFDWMGFNNRPVNNWDPWINSNWLACILLMEKNPEKRAVALHRSIMSLDHFIDSYTNDGGCEEGPDYWNRAAGDLFQCLDLLYSASNGAINLYHNQKINEMARYIYRMHICDDYFVNFADASATVFPDPGLLYHIGKQTNDPDMLGFASYFSSRSHYDRKAIKSDYGSLYDFLASFSAIQGLKQISPKAPLLSYSWLPDIQVCTARSVQSSCAGFFFAAKGGHDSGSHSHNDVGSFILYYNGTPLFIDVGVGDYTAQTFSSHRYEIWTMQSAYHNLPTINGVLQKNGLQYVAQNVKFKNNPQTARFSLDIAKAYPENAHVKTWIRTYTLKRSSGFELEDSYVLDSFVKPFVLSFMTFPKPSLVKPGMIDFQINNHVLHFHYPAEKFDVTIEKKTYPDDRLHTAWGRDYVYRILLTSKSKRLSGSDKFSILLPQK